MEEFETDKEERDARITHHWILKLVRVIAFSER